MTDKDFYNALDIILPVYKSKFFRNPDIYKSKLFTKLYELHKEYYTDKLDISKNSKLYNSAVNNIDDFCKGKNITIVNELIDKCKNLNKEDYNSEFDNIMNKHNDAWLKTETDIITKQSDNVKTWSNYSKLGDVMIKYVSAHDEKVRHNHKLLDGTVLPMTDKFWLTHTPPFDYNCRCTTMVVDEKQKDPSIDIEPTVGISNLRATGKVFSDEHPYLKTLNDK